MKYIDRLPTNDPRSDKELVIDYQTNNKQVHRIRRGVKSIEITYTWIEKG